MFILSDRILRSRIIVGEWIDSLTPEQRDKIIQHPNPTYSGAAWWSIDHNCGCLVGTAYDNEPWLDSFAKRVPECVLVDSPSFNPLAYDVGVKFPLLTKRFGAERMWRLVKARAAKANHPKEVYSVNSIEEAQEKTYA